MGWPREKRKRKLIGKIRIDKDGRRKCEKGGNRNEKNGLEKKGRREEKEIERESKNRSSGKGDERKDGLKMKEEKTGEKIKIKRKK